MLKKAVDECAAQVPAETSEKGQNIPPYRMLEALYVQTPLGSAAKTKEYRCIRCLSVAKFEIDDALLSVIGTEDILGDVLVNSESYAAGWLYAVAVHNGEERAYSLCPRCVAKDISAYRDYVEMK